MTIQEFIKQFSHNNEIVIENRDCYAMDLSSRPQKDGKPRLVVMDWQIEYTDIADCEIICISNVYRQPEIQQVITLRIDTDRKSYIIQILKVVMQLNTKERFIESLFLYHTT